MAQGAGTVGEGVTSCTVDELLDETLVGIREAPRVLREIPDDVAQSPLRLPPRAVSQALRSLVTNAQDASPPNAAVVVSARGSTGPGSRWRSATAAAASRRGPGEGRRAVLHDEGARAAAWASAYFWRAP